MKIKKAEYVASYSSYKQMPSSNRFEFAFIGRSNVGKSSLINFLLDRNELARTSSKPGKTQAINMYEINSSWNLIDLPGYGYAKVSKTEREKFSKLIFDYLFYRENLTNVFVLIDSRVEPQQIDIDFINVLGQNQVPFALVYTKCDKVKKNNNKDKMEILLKEFWEELPPIFETSSVSKMGKEQLINYLKNIMI